MNRFRKQVEKAETEQSDAPPPLRQFDENAKGEQSGEKYYRLQIVAYWLVPLLVLCAIIVGGVFAVLHFREIGEGSDSETEDLLNMSISGEVDIVEVLDAHIMAIGGREALNSVRSIRLDGHVLSDRGDYDFQILVSVPDKGMLVINPGEAYSTKLILNDDTAWQVSPQPDGQRQMTLLDDEATASLKWSLRVHDSFRAIALSRNPEGLTFREIEYEGKPCFELSKTKADGTRFSATLDKETLYLVRMEEALVTSGGQYEFTVLYDDHRMVSGVVEPYKTTLYRDGELDNVVEVDAIKINPGVMSSLFEVPEKFSE